MNFLPPALLLAILPATSPGDPSVKEIDEEYRAAVDRIYSAKDEAQEKAEIEAFQGLRRGLVDRALAVAAARPGSPTAVEALTWAVRNGVPEAEKWRRAIEALRRDCVASEDLGEACRWAANTAPKESLVSEDFLREVLARNPHPSVRGWASFALGELLETRADMLRDLDQMPEGYRKWVGEDALGRMKSRTVADLTAEAEDSYLRVARDFPDIPHPRTGKKLGEVAEGRAYRLRNLAVGRPVPEIEGVDVEGKPLRLSEYRGKVILLTFSGLWCGSCKATYPRERELLKRHRGRPFAILSVDTDEDKAPLRKAIASGEITWPCLWDGAVGGPITVRNGIYYFPTVFLIDHQGIVRLKDPREKPLDEAIETLVKEAERPEAR